MGASWHLCSSHSPRLVRRFAHYTSPGLLSASRHLPKISPSLIFAPPSSTSSSSEGMPTSDSARPSAQQVYVFFKSEQSLVSVQAALPSLELEGTTLTLVTDPAPPGGSVAAATSAPAACSAPAPSFNGTRFMSRLSTESLGHVLLATPEISSTQDFLRKHGSKIGEGVVMVADRQSSGKGRGGNQWTSPEGCLMFSAGQKMRVPGAQAPFINYVVSLAVVRGIAEAVTVAVPLLPTPLDVRIKWPNDIYTSSGLKIGGVLIHTTWSSGRFNVVTGVGLNVTNGRPTTCLEELLQAAVGSAGSHGVSSDRGTGSTSSGSAGGSGVGAGDSGNLGVSSSGGGVKLLDRELVLASILKHLEECFQVFETHGFAPLEEAYLRSWLHSGQQVMAHDPDTGDVPLPGAGAGTGSAAEPVALTIQGLSRQGFLQAEDRWGRAYELTPDGNSLDMMQGLIKRKV